MIISKIGIITKTVIETLEIDIIENSPILISDGNYRHIRDKHPEDYEKYAIHIPKIIALPNYIGKNPKDDSIEYIKEFELNNQFVKVAVRVSGCRNLFVRSMYSISSSKTMTFIKTGRFKKID